MRRRIMYKCVLFDMDGTLVDTYQGIYNSYAYALERTNQKFEGEKLVGKVIGAPLLTVFREQVGLSEENGCLLGVATLKREIFAKEILENLGVKNLFDVVYGIDEKDQLTKADIIEKCMEKLRTDRSETILIGDSEYDAEGADIMQIDFMAVTYGYGFKTIESAKKKEADLIGENGFEIAELILEENTKKACEV